VKPRCALQEVISSSVFVGARPEPGASLLSSYYGVAKQVLMCTVIRNIGIIWIVLTSSQREFRVRSSAETESSLKKIQRLIGSYKQH
jgi:hypothetical protein